MSDEVKASTPEKKTKRRGKKLVITFVVLIFLFVIGVSVLPVGLRYGAERWLRSMGQSNASIGNVDFNPFTGRLVIQTLGTAGIEGDELSLSHAILHLRWAELWNHRIFVEKFSLRDVALDVVRRDDGTMVIGGLPIILSGEPPEGEPWGFGLGGVTLENVEIRYRDPVMNFNMQVQDGSLERISSWESEVNTPIALTGIFDGGSVQLDGTIAPFRQAIRFDVATQIEKLPLTFLESAVADQGVSRLQGVFGTRLAVAGEINLSDESISLETKGNLSLSDIMLTADATRVEQGAFTWEGEAEFSGAYADPAIRIAGVSAVNDLILSVDSERIRLEHDSIQWDGTINLQSGDAKSINGVGALEMNGSQMLDREHEFFSLTVPGLSLRDVDVNYKLDSGTIKGGGNLVLTSPELVLDRADMGTISTDVDWGGTIRYWDGATLTELAGAIQFEDIQAEDVDDTTSRIRIATLTAGVETIETSKEEPPHTLDYSGIVTLANVEVTPIGTDYFIEQGQISWDGELQGDTDENNKMDVVFEANIEGQETTVSQIEKIAFSLPRKIFVWEV